MLGTALLIAVSSLIPLELPELAMPSRIYARPQRVIADQQPGRASLVARLRRLGYREIRSREPRPGEFSVSSSRLVLNRRAFEGPLGEAPDGRIELRFRRSGNLSSIRDPRGRRLPELLLEPELVGTFQGERRQDRILVKLEDVPQQLIDATLAIEDRRFFEHGGMDLRRLVGAFVANLRALSVTQGGSTLTQQLVKNLYLDHDRTLARKLHEAWLALRLERSHTKEEILEAYLNVIYLGQHGSVSVRGVEAGARHYFGKTVQELSLAECALIAGLVRGPGIYSPYRNPERALARRDLVLAILTRIGGISEREHQEAVGSPLTVLEEPPQPVSAPYFAARIERALQAELSETELERAGLAIFTGLDAEFQRQAQRAVRKGLERLEADFPHLVREESALQAALIALDPDSGDILALVGGRDWGVSQFDRATQARRQPGSVFKPIVALAALARGPDGRPPFTLSSLLEDAPLSVETAEEEPWTPANHDGEFRGWTSLRSALEQSINVPMARLGIQLGADRIIETARQLGVESRLNPVPSLALGSFETTALEITRAYAVLAAGGIRSVPRDFARVLDAQGEPLLEQPVETQRVFAADEIALVTSALEGAVERGTARSLRARGFGGPVAGKTGTTNGFRDAWFVGYTPELVTTVWVGFDDGHGLELSGAGAALPIFADFIRAALGPRGGREFSIPPGIEIVRVNAETGLLSGWGCPGEPELFLTGSAPVEHCGLSWTRLTRRGDQEPDDPVDSGPPSRPSRQPAWMRIVGAVLGAVEELSRELR